ncbi:MAG: SPOR domain-containing protein [Methylococcaceae bacterium]|nr:SPOR domain-containing protein [Methylococcaceae bacterium]
MAKDYKNRVPGYRNRASRNQKTSGVKWAIGLAVAAVGLGAWLIFHGAEKPAPRQSEPPPKTTLLPAPPPHPPEKAEDKKAVKPEDKKGVKPEDGKGAKPTDPDKIGTVNPAEKLPEPRFTFYKILPEKEVIIPESEIKTLKQEESQGKKPAIQYLLQAGSFPNPQDADKLKTRLSAIKIKSRIESVKIENLVWSRVKIGPFASLADADRVRTYLRSNQIDSVVQKAIGPAPHQPGR